LWKQSTKELKQVTSRDLWIKRRGARAPKTEMASFGACCFSGFVKTHNAKGELRKIGGESCYITPPNGNSADVILLCPDIFGIYPNSKLYADRLHEETGCTVVVAEFFGGGPGVSLDVMLLMARVMGGEGYFFRNKSFFAGLWDMITTYAAFFSYVPSMISFMWRNGRNLEPKFVYVDNLLSGLVVERGMKRFVAAGYCFGAPFATRLGASSKWQGIVKGISPTHGQIPETDIANLKVPGHFAYVFTVCCA
jgi:dienelactone hydrolase